MFSFSKSTYNAILFYIMPLFFVSFSVVDMNRTGEHRNVTVTVNTDQFCEMLETFLRPKLNMLHDMDNVWFQQYAATTHTSRRAKGILKEISPGHLISLRGDISWPARLPDLNPCDFFLWGYLKSKVYITLIALVLLNNLKMQFVKKFLPFHMK